MTAGAAVIVLAPLYSAMWDFTEVQRVLQHWDGSFLRYDYCMAGRPANRSMAAWSSLLLSPRGTVCSHGLPHPEVLPKRHVRVAAPPTAQMVQDMVEAAAGQKQALGVLSGPLLQASLKRPDPRGGRSTGKKALSVNQPAELRVQQLKRGATVSVTYPS